MKKKAYCVIRDQPHYRSEAFLAGLRAVGYEIETRTPQSNRAGDVFVCWNRYGYNHQVASHVESAGGTVLVAENGYVGRDENDHQLYAIARHGHNGSGNWEIARPPRWPLLGIEPKPWREGGGHILVCGQRGIGSPSMASPANWHEGVAARLRKITKRPVRIRLHPGNNAPKTPLADDLRDAYAVVIWSSSSGVQALIDGIPVFYEAPHWICARAAKHGIVGIEDPPDPYRDDTRQASLEYMAWAQWTVAEIAAGLPFRLLLK